MKNRKHIVLGLSLLGLLTLTSCTNNPTSSATSSSLSSSSSSSSTGSLKYVQDGQAAYNALAGVTRQDTYRYYESYMPSSLNSVLTMQSEDSRYIANIVDGLVDVDRTGAIVPALAERWTWNEDMSELTLDIRQGVPWVYDRNAGREIYKVDGVEQYVSADDWVYAAKENLTMYNGSDSYYLYTMFVEGAGEYYYYTYLEYLNAQQEDESKKRTDQQIVNTLIGLGVSPDTLTVDDLPAIANFSRVGIKSSEDGRKLTYTLTGTAPYFLSSLTYSPFFPASEAFVSSLPGGIQDYGTSVDNTLSCGAYVLDGHEIGISEEARFVANENYWDADHVMTKNVIAYRFPDAATDSSTRVAYESGTIDGFTVNERDSDGWKKYVTGEDGTGSLENPVSPDARVVEGLGDGSTFSFIINTNRDASASGTKYSVLNSSDGAAKGWNATVIVGEGAEAVESNVQILNTNKALSVSKALRALVLQSLDYETYSNDFGTSDYNRVKYLVNTWTPANFITYSEYDAAVDNADGIFSNDYVSFIKKAWMDKFYPEAGYSQEARDAADAALGYSQLSTGEHSVGVSSKGLNDTSLDETNASRLANLKQAASDEISAWNNAHPDDRITTPVIVEFPTLSYNDDTFRNSATFVNATNARLNDGKWYGGSALSANIGRPENAEILTSVEEDSSLLRFVIPTNKEIQDSRSYSIVSQNGYANIFISGWGPDYSDPLTFANTLVTNGDLSAYTGAGSDNPYYDVLAPQFEKYDTLVDEASALTDNKARFTKFGEAEVELLYEVSIVRPIYMVGLGKAVSISKVLPYRTSSAVYGVTNFKYKYVEVLNRNVTGEEYQALKAERYVQNSH